MAVGVAVAVIVLLGALFAGDGDVGEDVQPAAPATTSAGVVGPAPAPAAVPPGAGTIPQPAAPTPAPGAGAGARPPDTPPPAEATTPTTEALPRPTGGGTCAFLTTEDVATASGATPVALRQSQGPNGAPGCEWVLGTERAPLQLEFADAVPGTTSALPSGQEVSGPWDSARWVAGTRTLYVRRSSLSMIVRASDADPARARIVATNLAVLAVGRS